MVSDWRQAVEVHGRLGRRLWGGGSGKGSGCWLGVMKIAGALAIYRGMGTSVLFATKKGELEFRENPPLSIPPLVKVIPPSFHFHLFLSCYTRLGPLTTLSTAPRPPASPKSSTFFIFITHKAAHPRFTHCPEDHTEIDGSGPHILRCLRQQLLLLFILPGATHVSIARKSTLSTRRPNDVPRKTFDYIPVQHRLLLQYSDAKRVRELKSYRKRLKYTAELEGGVLRDFWDAKLCAELKKKGILTDLRSLAFNFSTDGMCLFRKGRQHTVHLLLRINYNLHLELRFEKRTSFAWESSQGPRSPRTYSPSCVLSSTNLRRSP